MAHDPHGPLAPQELALRSTLRILAFLFAAAALGYLLPALLTGMRASWLHLPFVTNSVVKVSVLGMIAFVAAGDVRRFRPYVVILILGHLVSEAAMILVLLFGDLHPPSWPPAPFPFSMTTTLVGAMVLDGIILLWLSIMFTRADQARYGLSYLNPIEFRALKAAADVLVAGEEELLTPEEVAYNVDTYLAAFQARRKWVTKAALMAAEFYPLACLRVPLSYMPRLERKQFLMSHFYQVVELRLFPGFLRTWIQAMIRILSQLSYLGYYNDPRTFASVGYVPFSERPGTAELLASSPNPEPRPLRVRTVTELSEETISADLVIVGSGAAGAILALDLVEAGLDVLLLERGEYVDPSTFEENEIRMLSRLYSDGALQLSRDFRFQVLQGSCVGGTTVVNNAVCFDLPEPVLERWNDPGGYNAGLNPDRLRTACAEVRKLVSVAVQDHGHLNPSGPKFLDGLKHLGLDQPPHRYGPVEANIRDCLGCGYCNIGCRYGRKLSMLDVVLPMAQAHQGAGRLRILADCEALRLEGRGRRITSVLCRSKTGKRVRVSGNRFVISGGAINSSILLLRSNVGGDRVGRGVSFNVGSPISAAFVETIDAYAGLQISHFLNRQPSRGYVLETWFNPPVAQALAMPGWFEHHFNNMKRFRHLASIGVLVGTKSTGRVQLGGLFGSEVDYTPDQEDLDRVLEGVVLGGRILFAGGAYEVMPHTFRYRTYRNPQELESLLTDVKDSGELALGTGHPQGGNAISLTRESGVVDGNFQVYGYDNLHVCDASVFPSSTGVNPQLTVMTLARFASPLIAEAARRGGNGA